MQSKTKPQTELTLEELEKAIIESWSSATSAEPEAWSRQYPGIGQCSVSAFVVQDYLGGEIIRVRYQLPDGRKGFHSYNLLPDGRVIDMGGAHMMNGVIYEPMHDAGADALRKVTAEIAHQQRESGKKVSTAIREQILEWAPNRARYERLKEAVALKIRQA